MLWIPAIGFHSIIVVSLTCTFCTSAGQSKCLIILSNGPAPRKLSKQQNRFKINCSNLS
jgi:hypothetical protein